MAITPIHGHMVLGRDEGGKPYSVYDSGEDHNRSSATERVILNFGRDDDGSMVVNRIESDGKLATDAAIAVNAAGHPEMAGQLLNPQKTTIYGVEFEVGGPANGKVVDPKAFKDPDVQAAIGDAEKNYEIASFASGVKIGGDEARAEAVADVSAFRDRKAARAAAPQPQPARRTM